MSTPLITIHATPGSYQLTPIHALHPHPANPRTHSTAQVDALASSLLQFGFTNPLLVSNDGTTVLAGHGRLLAAKRLGLTEVPTITVSPTLTAADQLAIVISDNQIALESTWDTNLLISELNATADAVDYDALGIDIEALTPPPATTDLFNDTPADEDDGGDEDDTPPLLLTSKPGSIWHLGRHRVMCGSALSARDMGRLMGSDTANFYLTDPPYNVAYKGAAGTIQNDSMDTDAFLHFLTDAFDAAAPYTAPTAVTACWYARSEQPNFVDAATAAGWTHAQTALWIKHSFTLGRGDFHYRHEPCLLLTRPGVPLPHLPDANLYYYPKPAKSPHHPTTKPIELFAAQIEQFTSPDAIVLDSFHGSGTTLLACEQTGRQCRAIDLEPKFVDIQVRRWQELTGQQATDPDGVPFDDYPTYPAPKETP